MLRRLTSALDRHWFAPASLHDLALVRIVVFGTQTLIFLLFPDGRLRSPAEQFRQATVGGSYYEPIATLRVLLLPFGQLGADPPDVAFLGTVFGVAAVAGVLATIGLFARPAMLLAAAANTLIVAHHYSYREFHHAEALMIIALTVLALGPSASVLSVDAARRRRRGIDLPRTSEFARWPLRLMQWLIALTYISAAYAKISRGGLEWFNGHTMTFHFLGVALNTGRESPALMATLPPAIHIVPSILAWTLEALFVIAVIAPRTAWLFVLGGIAMHLSVYATMGIAFFQTIVLYVVFAEALRLHWPAWLPPRRRERRAGAPSGD